MAGCGSALIWAGVAMTGDQPVSVVPVGEFDQRQAQRLDGLEATHPQQVFLESADEALGDAVALGQLHRGAASGMIRRQRACKGAQVAGARSTSQQT